MKAISHFLHFVTSGSKTDECPASAVSIFIGVFFLKKCAIFWLICWFMAGMDMLSEFLISPILRRSGQIKVQTESDGSDG